MTILGCGFDGMMMTALSSGGTVLDAIAGGILFASALKHARSGRANPGPDLAMPRRRMRGPLRLPTVLLFGAGGSIAVTLSWPRPLLHPALMLTTVLCVVLLRPGRRRRSAARGSAAKAGPRPTLASFTRIAALSADAAQLRISRLVHLLALRAGLDPCSADELREAAMLYRIGRIAVPEAILRKPAPLDAAELKLLRRKPEIGARILGGSRTALLDCAAELSLCHQERWDGSGYPRGLLGVQIPISARIVTLVATFDGLLSGAAGGVPWQPEQVVAHIDAAAGQLFDPQLAGLFLNELPSMLALREQP